MNPCRGQGSFLRWMRSAMRSRQGLETHLNRQMDSAGRRERISTRGSSLVGEAALHGAVRNAQEARRRGGEGTYRQPATDGIDGGGACRGG
nr:unnamed protein product [Digitaria exilis]